VLELNKPDDNHLPTWFEIAESRFLSAGVSTEEDRFILFRDALSDEQANAWGKFVSDAARTHSPYTHVKNAIIKRYEHRAHHRLFVFHNLCLKDGASYDDFMDRLIATSGHDWETNPLKCNEIRTAFLQVLPTELFWKMVIVHAIAHSRVLTSKTIHRTRNTRRTVPIVTLIRYFGFETRFPTAFSLWILVLACHLPATPTLIQRAK